MRLGGNYRTSLAELKSGYTLCDISLFLANASRTKSRNKQQKSPAEKKQYLQTEHLS